MYGGADLKLSEFDLDLTGFTLDEIDVVKVLASISAGPSVEHVLSIDGNGTIHNTPPPS